MSLKVEHYTAKRVPNPNPGGELSWQAYHTARNAVVRLCRAHGRTGDMGECLITDDPEMPSEGWHRGDRDPLDFFVTDDQLNHERYIYLEVISRKFLTAEYLGSLAEALRPLPGWGVGIKNIRNGYILVFADRLMVTGPIFSNCRLVETIARKAREALYD